MNRGGDTDFERPMRPIFFRAGMFAETVRLARVLFKSAVVPNIQVLVGWREILRRGPVGYAGLWFRGNFAFGWFTDLPDYLFGGLAFCSFSRLALGLDLLRSFAFCLCGSLHLRDRGSFSLCLLGRFALDLAGGFTLRLLGRLALRAFGSLDLRFLSGFALCLPRR